MSRLVARLIAVDGPAGSGKSSVVRKLSRELGLEYIDTGALFRYVGLELANGADIPSLRGQAEDLVFENQILQVRGESVESKIRSEEAAKAASLCATRPEVRDLVEFFEKTMVKRIGDSDRWCIMEGRDIGTAIFPDAPLKIYLFANTQVRATRRLEDLKSKGTWQGEDLATLEKLIDERDERDMNREVAPLKKADDAVEIDTSDLSFDEVVARLRELIEATIEKN